MCSKARFRIGRNSDGNYALVLQFQLGISVLVRDVRYASSSRIGQASIESRQNKSTALASG